MAGLSVNCKTSPHILTGIPNSFNMSTPVAVIGTGLGGVKKNCMLIPCAAEGVNHVEFFKECKSPRAHFVATNYGHMDMLDDGLDVLGKIADCMCANNGSARTLMRECTGGIVVAFLKAYLHGENGDFLAIVKQPEPPVTPIDLSSVDFDQS